MKDYQCDGQIELTDYLKSKISDKKVMDLTLWINSQGKSQYAQIGDVVRDTYERGKDSEDLMDRIINNVSVYVLKQSTGYMEYLRNESSV